MKLSYPSFNKQTIKKVQKVLKSGRVNYWTGNECKFFGKLVVGDATLTLYPLTNKSLIKFSLKFIKDEPLLAIIKICFIFKIYFYQYNYT